MTAVFSYTPDVDHFSGLYITDRIAQEWAHARGKGQAISRDWPHPVAQLMHIGEDRERIVPSDFPWFEWHMPAISDRAAQILRDLLEPHCELLPVECGTNRFWAVNVLTVLDALDTRAVVSRFSSGAISKVYQYSFKPDLVRGVAIFKLVGGVDMPPYLGSLVADSIRRHDLRGLKLDPLWIERA